MQERQGEAFVIATANDVSKLPPELMRKGRFDEVFFVDLPTVAERKSILQASLRTNGRSADSLDLDRVAAACFRDSFTFGFTGSEVSELVPTAMYAAYADGVRDITTADLLKAASETVPLSKTASEKISNLRQWAVGKARPATAAENAKTQELTGVEL
jgi:SpoVK/Ycf46/Vps4 family AAA+-type ATPase